MSLLMDATAFGAFAPRGRSWARAVIGIVSFASVYGLFPVAISGMPPGVKGMREVFFATDRNKKSAARFGDGRSRPEGLTLGRCIVTIPEAHVRGNVERPWSLRSITLPEDPSKHIIIQTRSELDTNSFYAAFNSAIDDAPERGAFVFVHGYNVPFDDAVRNTAQLAFDMQFRGPAISYSWPSAGVTEGYVSDIDAADWTVVHLETFLRDLRTSTGVRMIHIVAHSMGSRVATKALGQLAHSGITTAPFQKLVLAAPDIDDGVLTQLSTAIAQQTERSTVYTSSGDRALELATLLRFGPLGPVSVHRLA